MNEEEFRARLLDALGLTEDDMVAYEATPWRQAEKQAAAHRTLFVEQLKAQAHELSQEMTVELLADHPGLTFYMCLDDVIE